MATFECNFNSYCRGRPVTITVVVPTGGWGEFGFSDAMLNSMRDLAPDDFTSTIQFVPMWQRVNSGSHRPAAKFPVLYLLCGAMDDRKAWLYRTQAALFCEEQKMALVLVDPEGAEWHMERDYEFLAHEVHEFVCSMFPISDRPEDRYMAGYSRGAGGVVHHMLKAPEQFGAMGLFSGSITFFEDAPVEMTKQFFAEGKKLPPVYITTGDLDHSGVRLRWYRDLLIQNGADVTYEEVSGYNHGYRLCNIALERFLNWLPRTDEYAAHLVPSPERKDGVARIYKK